MRAYAPGSVTGLYAPPVAENGRSRGVSFATEDGILVDLEPATETTVAVDGEPAPFEPVERVLEALSVTAAVSIEPDVPLGCGFGASGAATLATALAANAAVELGRSRGALLEAAHRAEVDAGTGQGDVYIQAQGGLLWSEPDGVGRAVPAETIEYATVGGIETEKMLADESFLAAANRVGTAQIDALERPPTIAALADRSRRYVEGTDVATPFVERLFERVDDVGGHAGMALFGETVFAVDADGTVADRAVDVVGDHPTNCADRPTDCADRPDRVIAGRTTVAGEGARVLDGNEQ